ncbi:MAG: ATP phosphoribosyltransferase [Planctomycetota bacterium]
MILKLALPSGSLQQSTLDLMAKAGFEVRAEDRSYYPSIDDPEIEIVLFRAQEVSRYVADGVMDAGVTGIDWILENGSDVVEVAELVYSKRTSRPARWVLAVPEESPVQTVKDLDGKVIATEAVNLTERFLEENDVHARIEFSWGSTEVKAGIVDAIVELTETGSSLRSNRLRVVADIIQTTPRLIANRNAWADEWKRTKIDDLATLLKSAIVARSKVVLKLNTPEQALDRVLELLPALHTPTVSPLSDDGWYAVETVLNEWEARELIPELKRAGAQGIIEFGLHKVIP